MSVKRKNSRRRAAPDPVTAAVPHAGKYTLRLFVAGASSLSRQAILRIRELCAGELKGRCDLRVIDIYQQPALARANQILATPTLLKNRPLPMRRYIGDLPDLAALQTDLT